MERTECPEAVKGAGVCERIAGSYVHLPHQLCEFAAISGRYSMEMNHFMQY